MKRPFFKAQEIKTALAVMLGLALVRGPGFDLCHALKFDEQIL
jgi:hypothetical protein